MKIGRDFLGGPEGKAGDEEERDRTRGRRKGAGIGREESIAERERGGAEGRRE
jgi:hypothetical protein